LPVHIDMLELCGVKLSRLEEDDEQLSDGARIAIIRDGRAALRRLTGVDFGYDIGQWEECLLHGGEDFGYRHPYGYGQTARKVQETKSDPEHARLVAALIAKDGCG